MDFHPPQPADLANVRSLNGAFLGLVRDSASGKTLRQQLPRDLDRIIAGLSDPQLQRLSESPFLLMSFREHDKSFWNLLDQDTHIRDLFLVEQATDDKERLVMAGLGFLWQLANGNPFAARLVSGAPIDWCDRIAESTLFHLLQAAAGRSDMLGIRFAGDRTAWDKLLSAGIDSRRSVRAAAQMAVMQSMLTADGPASWRGLRAAARTRPLPTRQRHGASRPG